MNKKIPFPFFCSLLFVLFCSGTGFSQTPGTLWAHNAGAEGKSIAADAAGNVYTTGFYNGTHDFDQGPDSLKYTSVNNSSDIFIQKLDASGNLVWAKSLGGKYTDNGNSIAVDASGNVYIAGFFYDTLDADPGTNVLQYISKGGKDILIQKYDASGNLLWADQFGETGDDEAKGITVDGSGNVYVTGAYYDTVDFDPGAAVANLAPTGAGDVFVLKLTASGAYSWAKTVGGNYLGVVTDVGFAIALDGTGNVYVTGSFLGAGDFNPGTGTATLTSAGNADVFVLKLTSAGVYSWARRIGAANYEESSAIAIDGSSNVLVTGYFVGTVDFDPSGSTANLSSLQTNYKDAFVWKLTSAGNYSWARRSGSTSTAQDGGNGIATDASGNVYVTGGFGFNSTNTDVYIQKWNSAGTLQWDENIATSSTSSRGNAIAYRNAAIYVTGYFSNSFSGTDDFHPGTYVMSLSPSNGNGFVVKMKECTATSNVVIASFCTGGTYTFGNQTLTTIGSYTGQFLTTNGCDSTVTLHLVIENPLPVVTANASVDSACGGQSVIFTGGGANTYTWSDGITDGVPHPVSATQTYTVTGVDTNNCQATAVVDVLVVPPHVQEICVVTVDSALADHTIIIWEKPMDLSGIDSFFVYREITLNNYQKVGAVHKDSLSEFHDFGANPNSTNYKYKIATLDTCGNTGTYGLYHNTIQLQYFSSGNFQWTNYEIESLPNPVASYNFYRDDNSTGNFQLLQIIPGGNNSYTDVNYATYPNASYRVDVNWAVAHFCAPTRGAINTSRSNIKSPSSAIGLHTNTATYVTIYPQPAKDAINIEFDKTRTEVNISVYDNLGKLVLDLKSTNTKIETIDISGLAEGMYWLKLVSDTEIMTKKIAIVK
ncbi:MAG: hypothetical protein K0S33_2318 [Bacteroidetes bacterium]|jgi:hypothetical protein|nr:hypothetical protein [Bacteroidota bacterium]